MNDQDEALYCQAVNAVNDRRCVHRGQIPVRVKRLDGEMVETHVCGIHWGVLKRGGSIQMFTGKTGNGNENRSVPIRLYKGVPR